MSVPPASAFPDRRLRRVDAAVGTSAHPHPDTAGFWDSLDRGLLSLQRCTGCSTLRFPLSTHCHECLGADYSWEAIDPAGVVNVAIRVHEAVSDLPASGVSLPEPWRGMTPYLSGVVNMAAGVRIPGRIVCRCEVALTPGTPVTAALLDTVGGGTVHGFVHDCE